MKINDKHLAAYGTSPEGIDKEGFLNKRGEVNKVFQRRWFVLKGNLLFYCDRRGDKPNGVIILEDCSVEVSDADRYSFTITFFGGKTRVYILSADNEEEMIGWIKRISTAPFGYAKMVMKELEKRHEKLKKNELELLAKQKEESAKMVRENERENNLKHDVDNDLIVLDDTDNLTNGIDHMKLRHELTTNKRSENVQKAKFNSNRMTIDVTGHPKSFNNLLTVVKVGSAMKNNILPYVKRSKSSENLHKLTSNSLSTSPVQPRRRMNQSVKRKKAHLVKIEHNIDTNVVVDSSMTTVSVPTSKESLPEAQTKSIFCVLHNQYAASIWTSIRDYENGSSEDLLKFD